MMLCSNKIFAYTLSLLMHIVIFLIFIFYKNSKFIMPSQSDGISVAIINNQEFKQDTIKHHEVLVVKSAIVKPILDADIKLKSNKLVLKNESSNKNIIKPKDNKLTLVVKEHKPKTNTDKVNQDLTNELLSSLHDLKANGKSNGQNIGGNQFGSGNNKIKINNYANQVINLVRPNVIIPEGIENKLLVIVKVVLLPNMNVYSTKVIKSSGNIIYDNNVVNAINIVKKFPDIPEGEKWLDYRVINLTFKSEQ